MTAPTPMVLRKGQIMTWAGVEVTEHNRSELSITPKRYENMQRMWNARARKYVIADKYTFSVNWTKLPSESSWTVDGKMGGKALKDFWHNNAGAFTMRITNGDGTYKDYSVMITDFSWKIVKRAHAYDLWDVSVELEEA